MTDNHAYEAFTAFQEGTQLLASSNPHAAATVLERARNLEPDQGSIREASQVIRVVLTGSVRSPDLEQVAAALGPDEVLRRIRALRAS